MRSPKTIAEYHIQKEFPESLLAPYYPADEVTNTMYGGVRYRTPTKPNSKQLTNDQVLYIRSSNKTTAELALELGVTYMIVYMVRKNLTYKKVQSA